MRTVHNILLREAGLCPRLANQLAGLAVVPRHEVEGGVAILILDAAPRLARPAVHTAGDSLSVCARLEQAVHDCPAQLRVVEAHGEV